MSKCIHCSVFVKAMASTEPACCPWYEENVPSGEKFLGDCTVHEPVKPDDCEVGNTFESEEDYDDED